MKKILITGAAGFIGSSLANHINDPKKLMLIDDMSQGKIKNLNKNLRHILIKKPVENVPIIDFKKINFIIHLAAQSVVKYSIDNFYLSSKKNLISFLYIFQIAKKYNLPVIFASSSAVYGSLTKGDDTKDKISILSPYAQDKYTTEQYAKLMSEIYNIKSVGLRFFNVYGPNQKETNPYSGVIPIFANRAKKNSLIKINGGYQTRDFIFVDDVIKIIIKLIKKVNKYNNFFDIFNVCTGQSHSINKLYSMIKRKLKSNSKKKYYKMLKNDPVKSSGSNLKLVKFLNIEKNFFTNFENGLSKFLKKN